MKPSGSGSAEDGLVFHIAENQLWQQAGENYGPSAFSQEGFVHLSTRSQVLATAQRYYAGRSDLTLIAIQVSLLPQPLVYENLLGGEELFPHYYAEIPRSAVLQSAPLLVGAEGEFSSTVLHIDF